MSHKKLRSGITTGTCAAAAAKAAVLAWQGIQVKQVEVTSPQGKVIVVPIAATERTAAGGRAKVIKDAGDDPDITNGVEVIVEADMVKEPGITIKAGTGIGVVTKPGLSVPVGEPAVNPGPRQMITEAVRSVSAEEQGVVLTISIPDGEKLAKRTLNPILGVEGGLSVIGTTGIVEPMSEEAFKSSLAPQISVVKALGFNRIVFVPGKIGYDMAVKSFSLPEKAVVQTSNFIGYMLECAVEYDMKEVLILGHLGKIVKVAAGIFHTHNRMADARMETIAAHMAAYGAPRDIVREILSCTTTEAVRPIIEGCGMKYIYSVLAEKASLRAQRYVFNDLKVGTAIVSLKGELLGLDEAAREIGGNLEWKIESS